MPLSAKFVAILHFDYFDGLQLELSGWDPMELH